MQLLLDSGADVNVALDRESDQRKADQAERGFTALTFASHALSKEKHLLMPLWQVTEFSGEPVGAEGQALAWVDARELTTYEMPAADVPLPAAPAPAIPCDRLRLSDASSCGNERWDWRRLPCHRG